VALAHGLEDVDRLEQLPMVFVKGVLVGGANDLKALHESGQLRDMLG